MRKVSIYIEDTRESGNYSQLELFNDEEININLSVQNIKDISKVFTDFTQSFTIPASSINNALLRYFYENSVDLDTAVWDNRLRINAYIEINQTPFRNGKIELEKANIVKGRVESYTITFYGTLVNLKDTFGEDKLSDLDYSTVEFAYDGTEVYNRITDDATDYDVRYPLISSDRLWSFGDSTSTDISITGGAIDYTELFPALKVPKIFDLIELKYGITFNGLYLSDQRFNDLFLWYKSKKTNDTFTEKQVIDITSGNSLFYNSITDEISASNLKLHITNTSSNAKYYIDVIRNNTLVVTLNGNGNKTFDLNTYSQINQKIKCYIYSQSSLTLSSQYQIVSASGTPATGGVTINNYFSINANNILNINSNLTGNAPDMKIADFVSGILKMFNLTCTAQTVDSFLIEPLDWWYNKGAVIDITKYVDDTNIDIKKVPLYKRLNFKYQESKSFLSKDFELRTGKPYGDLEANFDFNGDEYTIDVPFENLVQSTFEEQDVQVGYTLDENYSSYIPKPILLYQHPKRTMGATGIKFNDGSTIQTITQYIPLGQDAYYNSNYYTLNFAPEQSTLTNLIVTNTLYQNYYSSYINNLFKYKNRLVSLKCILPISLITNLKLNDRLIIRDKRYTINNISTNLNTGEVQLELLSDLRDIANDNATNVGSGAGSIFVPVNLVKKSTLVNLSTVSAGVSFSSTSTSNDSYIEVTYPVNPNALNTVIDESSIFDLVDETGYFTLQNEEATVNIIEILETNTLENGEEVVFIDYIYQAE